MEDIAKEKNEHMAINVGTEQHQRDMWVACRNSKLWRLKGERVKLGRWSSWIHANRWQRGERMALLLVLTYMGVRKGWWRTADDIPSFLSRRKFEGEALDEQAKAKAPSEAMSGASVGGTASGASAASSSSSGGAGSASAAPGLVAGPVVGAAAPSSSGASGPITGAPSAGSSTAVAQATLSATSRMGHSAPRAVKDSNAQLKEVRQSAENTLHFAALVLSNAFGNQMSDVVDVGLKHFSDFFDMQKTRMKTARGFLELKLELARGGMANVVVKAFEELDCPASLEQIGFLHPFEHASTQPGGIKQETQLAEVLLELILSTGTSFLCSSMVWSHTYPGHFVLLASADERDQARCLQEMQVDFERLTSMERAALTSPAAKSFLTFLRWPAEQFCREMFVMCYESGWRMTPEIAENAKAFAAVLTTTNINEDLFNRYRTAERAHSAQRLSRLSRWHVALNTRLLQEYGRTPVVTTDAGRSLRPVAPPAAAFAGGSSASYTLPLDSLEHFEKPDAFPRLSPAALKLRGTVCNNKRQSSSHVP